MEKPNWWRSLAQDSYGLSVLAMRKISTYVSSTRSRPVSQPQLYGFCCWVDGSFKDPLSDGTGYILFDNSMLVHYWGVCGGGILSLLCCIHHIYHIKGLSLLPGMCPVQSRGIEQCKFYSDSEVLVQSLTKSAGPGMRTVAGIF